MQLAIKLKTFTALWKRKRWSSMPAQLSTMDLRMPRLAIALAIILAASLPGFAEDRQPMPDTLTFGYDEEGKVDASQSGCEGYVRENVEWPEPDMSNAIKDVCGARKRHVEAYAAIQKSYKALAKQIAEDKRLDTAAAVTGFEVMIKACIDHKSNVTTGGHNIMIDVIPNDIAARCLDMGRAMLDEETTWLTTDPAKERAHFSP
jgi:hypothetical protein